MRVPVAIGGLLAASSLAWAADIAPGPYPAPPPAPPPPPPYSWTGIYVGANAGGSFVNESDTGTITGGLLNGVFLAGTGSANGALAGGQLGFNYQINSIVLGIEGDFDWSGLSGSKSLGILTRTGKIEWLGTIRARAGFAIDRLMIYGTGGVAFVPLSDEITAAGFGTLYSASSTNVGWTIGAGVEGALAPNWTVRAEYLFVQSNVTLSGPFAVIGGTLAYTGTISDNVVRAGVNFKYP